MKIEKKYWFLIVRSYSDELTESEQEILDQWISASSTNSEFYQSIGKVLDTVDHNFQSIEPNDQVLWEKLKTRIEADQSKQRTFPIKWVSVAAGLALLLALGIFFLNEEPSIDHSSPEYIAFSTTHKPQELVLPDGSVLLVSKNSTLEYHPDFKNNRKTKLDGEAYFAVERDSAHPFSVLTKNTQTLVVGTEFQINSEDEENVEILVTEGVVRFGGIKDDELVTLKEGEQAKHKTANNTTEKKKIKKVRWRLLKKIKKMILKTIEKLKKK